VGPEPEGARLTILPQSHEYGQYLEVVVKYNGNLKQAAGYASRCEDEAPATWAAAGMSAPAYGVGRRA
jgi:hypothetical protein